MMPDFRIEEYLGDGVYATYDGYHVVLDLRAQVLPGQGMVKIALEPEVLTSLDRFRKQVDKLNEQNKG
ncbi:MAG: hypothetical protein ACTSVR_03200 [Candidatus Thorarchaeota archaeon]